jgi:hypothetical protein
MQWLKIKIRFATKWSSLIHELSTTKKNYDGISYFKDDYMKFLKSNVAAFSDVLEDFNFNMSEKHIKFDMLFTKQVLSTLQGTDQFMTVFDNFWKYGVRHSDLKKYSKIAESIKKMDLDNYLLDIKIPKFLVPFDAELENVFDNITNSIFDIMCKDHSMKFIKNLKRVSLHATPTENINI